MITNRDIAEKAEELLAERIADNSYLNDALPDCFAEIRALYAAVKHGNRDDELSALNDFIERLDSKIAQEDVLNAEAYDFLRGQEALKDNSDNWKA